MTRRALPGWFGLLGAGLYVATVAAIAAATPGHDPARQLISELGELGAPHAPALRVMLIVVGVIAVALGRALQVELGGRLGPALMAVLGAGLVLGGVFPCDPTCAPVSVAGWLHILTSIPATLAALVAPFVFARAMRRAPAWRRFAATSQGFGYAAVASIGAAFLVFPACGVPGIGQKLATLVQLAWMGFMALSLVRVARCR